MGKKKKKNRYKDVDQAYPEYLYVVREQGLGEEYFAASEDQADHVKKMNQDTEVAVYELVETRTLRSEVMVVDKNE